MTHLLIHSYSASYDRTTKVISLAVGVFLPGLGLYTGNPYLFVLGVFIVLGGYAYSPRRYSLDGRSIVIHRLAGNVSLPLEGLRRASPAAAEDLRGCIRLWGSGGLFGYYGLFRTSSLGRCTWYVTNRAKMVVVETSGKTVLVSPDDVDGFLAAVRGLAPATAQPAGAQGAPSGGARRGAGMTARLAGGAIALAGIAIVIFALLYAPGPPSYTLTERSLAIHDRLYPVTLDASAVDTAGVRVVDIAHDADWRPTARTNGFANAHYRAGWFRVANGQKVRLYRADGTRLVLIPPKGGGSAVLLEAGEPERLIADLKRQWAGLR
jgi:hypothetical protein